MNLLIPSHPFLRSSIVLTVTEKFALPGDRYGGNFMVMSWKLPSRLESACLSSIHSSGIKNPSHDYILQRQQPKICIKRKRFLN